MARPYRLPSALCIMPSAPESMPCGKFIDGLEDEGPERSDLRDVGDHRAGRVPGIQGYIPGPQYALEQRLPDLDIPDGCQIDLLIAPA